ncbi:RNA methyltransferase [Rufibacter latericius]|uniref:TrmH family RNA methyltransferase n=1 Tax=Rufibacter latericius TaxID=2487040 RepID=A0A3M9MDV9_9BACT|nr:RNA methyltransferase [Rufibacter latericius]RNI23739.1 TrmH family RNA methyltransferase [Rufibacter latericius]
MARNKAPFEGYFGIGIMEPKTEANVGTLWRSASILGASFLFTIGRRYKKQSSDTNKAWKDIPLFNYADFDDFYQHLPYSCQLVGIELDDTAVPVEQFQHPERCIYLLGSEDHGLPNVVRARCHYLVQLPGASSMNVASAGSIMLYDRHLKTQLPSIFPAQP